MNKHKMLYHKAWLTPFHKKLLFMALFEVLQLQRPWKMGMVETADGVSACSIRFFNGE